ncbi:MAG: toxin TcdB middle/N-terminal domain-containing protein, partial [Myxococcota bacterium]
AAEAEAAGTPWASTLPIPMQLVSRIDRYVTLTGNPDGSGLHEVTSMSYRDGFYDGVEKQYRGFEQVQTVVAADAFQEASTKRYVYDVGRSAPHRNGLALSEVTLSDDRILNETTTTYEECALTEVPPPATLETQGRRGVYFVCPTAVEVVHKEGLTDAAAWKTVRSEMLYDGYGNVTLDASLGVVGVDGDELYTETEYVTPAARWLIGLPSRTRVYDTPGIADFSETLTYYDGDDFVGLPLGQATEGFVSRVTQKVDVDGTTLSSSRARRDAHGNSVETIDPNGTVSDASTHRRRYTYDDTGFFLITTDLLLGDRSLRRESRYEQDFQRVVEVTKWMLVEGGELKSNRDSDSFLYDSFGRLSAELKPGDPLDKPSKVFTYDLSDPVSRIVARGRSTVGGDLDEESFTCLDGRGRAYQTRTRVETGSYQVTGFSAFNARGVPVQVWQPFMSSTGACDFTVPESVLVDQTRFDALGRGVEVTRPGAAIYGEDLVQRTIYLPLATESHDAEDTHPSGDHADTPVVRTMDGLGRMVAVERVSRESG